MQHCWQEKKTVQGHQIKFNVQMWQSNSFLINMYTVAPAHLIFEHISSLNSLTQCAHA
jgi:hypothetical protein